MIQAATTSTVDGIGRTIMGTNEIHMIIREITAELETPVDGMREMPKREQTEVINGRLELARMKNHFLVEIKEEPIRYRDIDLAAITGISPEAIRHMFNASSRKFQKKVLNCRHELIDGLREADRERKSQSDEPMSDLPNPHWNEEDARARMGGNN